MRSLLGQLALPFVGAVLLGSCSPSTGSPDLYVGNTGPTGGVGTGGYADYFPTGGTYSSFGGSYATGGYAGSRPTGGWGGATGGAMTGTGSMGVTGGIGAGGSTVRTGGTGSGVGGNTGMTTTGGSTGMTTTGGTTSNPNTGGTSSSTGGKEDPGTGGEESTDGPFTVKAGGYVTSGAMKGYAWTGGDDVTPEDFSDLAAGGELCASGTVPATEDYSGTGMIGINLNQATTGASKGSPYTPTGSGVRVAITNDGGSPLRLQLQGSKDYCTDITEPGGSFDWSDFTVGCWEAGGDAYDASVSITAIMVLVPGEGPDGADVSYDFCITNVEEIP
jgi:hypothetical protein